MGRFLPKKRFWLKADKKIKNFKQLKKYILENSR